MGKLFSAVKNFFKELYATTLFFIALAVCATLFILRYFFPIIGVVSDIALIAIILIPLADIVLLFVRRGVFAERKTPDRLSNGDDNPISIICESLYGFPIRLSIIDEIPHQFQRRDIAFRTELSPGESKTITYQLKPTQRGVYQFGDVNVFVSSPLRMIERRFRFSGSKDVAVYPSFLQMRKYELFAISNRLTQAGIRRIRRIGNAREFDQIREYVQGDEYRTVNWSATARRSQLMVNQYQDEKSQNVYAVIDMGRAMKMPFNSMTLLDYAINSALVMASIAMLKDDKAGLLTFNNHIGSLRKAEKSPAQLQAILETLYNQETTFAEPDYELLYTTVKRTITQRSLLLLYTNFESLTSLKRQLPYFIHLAKSHVVCVIFFENTELKTVLDSEPTSLEDIYIKTIAEKFAYEKKQIVRELEKYGIYSVLTAPEHLTVNTINKYLEIKSRGVI
jgi:uncharacterized protein (DUF58 family)